MSDTSVDLKGKVAFITGGGSGIGRGFGLHLARCGATIVVADLNTQAVTNVSEEVIAQGAPCRAHTLDVSDPASLETAVTDTIDRFGQIDFLFANAGVLGPTSFSETTPEDWDLVLDVNIKGVVYTCRAVAPHMMDRRQGRILMTASPNGVRPGGHVIPYRVSKAAVLMYTRCLALVMAPYQVTVNAICPGVTMTKMEIEYIDANAEKLGITPEQYITERSARIPLQGFTQMDDLTALAEFLVSDKAGFITGQAIAVDGGMMLT
jgi:NAD(P)-dependent dehydrogenase (short-subunit alcohol dehydrogenase family)